MIKLVFCCSRYNSSSVNALAAAVEADGPAGLEAVFAGTSAGMLSGLRRAADCSGVTVAAFSFFSCHKEKTAALVKRLRRAAPGAVFVAGWPHATAAPQETLGLGFDYVIAGEGEKALPELLKALAGRKAAQPGIIRGTPAALDDHAPFPSSGGRFGPIEITRGCPYACSYCQTSFLSGVKPRHRSVGDILRHMGAMLSSGHRDIRFITPDAFAYGSPDGREINLPAFEDFMRSSAELAKKNGGRIFVGSFPSEVRPEHVTHETLELVKKHAYNRRLVIGAQAASARSLKAINRGHGPEDIINAARLCREHKLFPYLDFIFGLPGETREDEDAAMEMITLLSSLGAMIHTHAFMPLPGTPLAAAPGAVISARMARFIGKMEARGKAFGKWREQAGRARCIRPVD